MDFCTNAWNSDLCTCNDMNECLKEIDNCTESEICLNKEGSFGCYSIPYQKRKCNGDLHSGRCWFNAIWWISDRNQTQNKIPYLFLLS